MGQPLRSSSDAPEDERLRTGQQVSAGQSFADPLSLRVRIRRLIGSLRARVRCYRRTRGLHELDIATGRCSYCKREWSRL